MGERNINIHITCTCRVSRRGKKSLTELHIKIANIYQIFKTLLFIHSVSTCTTKWKDTSMKVGVCLNRCMWVWSSYCLQESSLGKCSLERRFMLKWRQCSTARKRYFGGNIQSWRSLQNEDASVSTTDEFSTTHFIKTRFVSVSFMVSI